MLQLPETHEGVPLAALQAFPHPPQCDVEVPSVTSQPLEALPSQFP